MSDSTPKRWNWKPKLRWFAAEYLIVVLGVLTAVGLNAWWGGQQEAEREQSYLRQLAADLQETERIVAEANAAIAPWDRSTARLLESFRMPERPPLDSLRLWIGGARRVNRVRPVVGTAEALVATGDLNLLRNDSLRSAITAYLERNQHQIRAVDDQFDWFLNAALQLAGRIDPLEETPAVDQSEMAPLFNEAFPYNLIPEGARRTPFPIDLEAFYQDREAYAAVQSMAFARRLMAAGRLAMLNRASTLREQIETELNR